MDTKLICLALLSERERTGYEIRKLFETRFAHFFVAGFGSIYPALNALAKEGLITLSEDAEGGRQERKVYAITEAGMDELKAALLRVEPKHKIRSEFMVLMYFAHLMPPERAIGVLDRMAAEWQDELDCNFYLSRRELNELTAGQRFDLGFARAVVEAKVEYCRSQRDNLREGLERERAAGRAGTGTQPSRPLQTQPAE